MEDKTFMIYELSNGKTILGLVDHVDDHAYEWLNKPVQLIMTNEGFVFMPWAPYAKDGELIPVFPKHIVSSFLASHPIAEAYYNQTHCKVDVPQKPGLVLP